MLFEAPVWGMALLTAPFIFASAGNLFGSSCRKLHLKKKRVVNKIQRLLNKQNPKLFKTV